MAPVLHEVVDTLYKGVESVMPDALKERPMAMAPLLGFAGAFGLIKGVHWLAKTYTPTFYNGGLKVAEQALKWGLPAAVVAYGAIDNEGAMQILDANPVYTVGMAGAYLGGVSAVAHSRADKASPKDLETQVNEPSK